MDIGYRVRSKNPKEGVNFLSKLFFSWMIKIVRKGIELKDLYIPFDKDKSRKLTDRLELYWETEVHNARKKNGTPSLLKALTKTFIGEFMFFGVIWFLFFAILKSIAPVILSKLISLYSNPYSEDTKNQYYTISGVLIGVITLSIFFSNHATFGLSAIGMRLRVAASGLIYRKITRLSHKSMGEIAAGQVINLLSNDVTRFDLVTTFIHSFWVVPIQIIILSYIIWMEVGVASLAGFCSMVVVSLPVQIYVGKLMGKLRASISKKTDKRVKLMSEIISGIQVIKMYAWEKSFEKLVKLTRLDEIGKITITSYLRGVFASCIVVLERSSLFFTILCFVLQGNTISAEIVFSLAQAFNVLQLGMAGYLSWAIGIGSETLVSVQRLQDFLQLEEKEETTIDYSEQPVVRLLNVNASWKRSSTRTLGDLLFEVPPGSLCVIVGPVGAGKSSLLQLLLGELPITTGRVQLGKYISYSSQNPWIFQSTIRNNILFGQHYNKVIYDQVIKVCALEKDLEQFPQGDRTEVGERGASLSGGQKARINLARAVYKRADIYLFDDPLSAVDAHVSKHLFEECIKKYLGDKTRILVTHQLQYLKSADLIIVLNEGQIEAKGTFDELRKSNVDFTKLFSEKDDDDVVEEETGDIYTSKHLFTLSSITNDISMSTDVNQDSNHIIMDEEQSGNDPNSRPFRDYILASKNMCLLLLLIIMLIIAQAICAGTDLWVAFWTYEEKIRYQNKSIIISSKSLTNNSFSLAYDDFIKIGSETFKVIKTEYALDFYAVLTSLAIIFTVARSFLFFKMCMMSSMNLHTKIFHSLLQAPMKFFDANSSGRILNRVSKDMGAIDEVLPREILDAVQIFLVLCGILINVAITNQYSIIIMVILGFVSLKMMHWYISTAKSLKHLEAITKSPVYSHITSTITGIVTIRASKVQDLLIIEFDDLQDTHTSAWYLLIACISSFGLWVDLICVLFISSICISFIILHSYSSVSGSMVGLALAQSMTLTTMLQYGIRQTAEVINQLTSVERVMEYTKIETEGPFDTPDENRPKAIWPSKGRLDFDKISLKYNEDEAAVLKELEFSIKPGEKIGIVGRTGSGKSSLISTLFRLNLYEGTIYIDGRDISTLGLTDLRKKISIIPQEPVLFSASLRYNLDPFGEFKDEDIWNVLEQVELKDFVDTLDHTVTEGGSNFSIGQRQLICLARAVLRNNKILVLDEATANVDPGTDVFIQTKIREKFKDCTVLTVAHRLNTIMDSDRVMVMSFGNIVEFDAPHKLLQNPDGYLSKLVQETGTSMAAQLKDIASDAFIDNNDTLIDI